MSDEGIKARLKAAREELGTLEFEGLRAIQSAQRCIARGFVAHSPKRVQRDAVALVGVAVAVP